MKKMLVLLGMLLLLSYPAFAEGPERTITVEPGDTLWGLAAKFSGYGTNWGELARYNGLSSKTIHLGQELAIPKGWPAFYSLDTSRFNGLQKWGADDIVVQAKKSLRSYEPENCVEALAFPDPTGWIPQWEGLEVSSSPLEISFPAEEPAVVWPMGVVWDPTGEGTLLTQGYESAFSMKAEEDCWFLLPTTLRIAISIPEGPLERGPRWEELRSSAYYEKGTFWYWEFLPHRVEDEVVVHIVMASVSKVVLRAGEMPEIGPLDLVDARTIDWIPDEEVTIVQVRGKWQQNIPELKSEGGWMPWNVVRCIWHPVVRRADGSNLLINQWKVLFYRKCEKEEGCISTSVIILPEHVGTVWRFNRSIGIPIFVPEKQ